MALFGYGIVPGGPHCLLFCRLPLLSCTLFLACTQFFAGLRAFRLEIRSPCPGNCVIADALGGRSPLQGADRVVYLPSTRHYFSGAGCHLFGCPPGCWGRGCLEGPCLRWPVSRGIVSDGTSLTGAGFTGFKWTFRVSRYILSAEVDLCSPASSVK